MSLRRRCKGHLLHALIVVTRTHHTGPANPLSPPSTLQLLAAHVVNPAHIDVDVSDVSGLDDVISELVRSNVMEIRQIQFIKQDKYNKCLRPVACALLVHVYMCVHAPMGLNLMSGVVCHKLVGKRVLAQLRYMLSGTKNCLPPAAYYDKRICFTARALLIDSQLGC